MKKSALCSFLLLLIVIGVSIRGHAQTCARLWGSCQYIVAGWSCEGKTCEESGGCHSTKCCYMEWGCCTNYPLCGEQGYGQICGGLCDTGGNGGGGEC